MCPCPICATIAILLLPFAGYKWAKNFIKRHHRSCERCQTAEHEQHLHDHKKCHCNKCEAADRLKKTKPTLGKGNKK